MGNPTLCNDPRHDEIEAWYRKVLEVSSTPAEALPLRVALERLLAVSMTEEEDVSAATQDEWIAAIKQANDALAGRSSDPTEDQR